MDTALRETLHHIEQLMNDGQIENAIEMLEVLSQEYPDNYHIVSLLGECFLMNGQPDKAIKPLQWATKTFPAFRKEMLKELNAEPEDNEEEEITVKRIRKTQERTSEKNIWVDHYLLGCAYGRTLQFRPAIRHLNIADKMNPENSEIIRNIGWIRCMQDKADTGRNLLQKAIKLDPENALAYNDLGASYLFEDQLDEAEKWIKKAVNMDPEDNFIQNTADKLEEVIALRTISTKKGRIVSREK